MPEDDNAPSEKTLPTEAGIEYRATIRFPRKDYEFMQNLIENGEYANITDIVRDAVKRFRLEWRDMDEAQAFMPMGPMMGPRGMMGMMMRRSFGHCGRPMGRSHGSHHDENDHEETRHGKRNVPDDEEDDEEHSEE